MTPSRKPMGWTFCPTVCSLPAFRNDHRQVARPLEDRAHAPPRLGAEPLQRPPLVCSRPDDIQLSWIEIEISLRIGRGGLDHLSELASGALREELQRRERVADVLAADDL